MTFTLVIACVSCLLLGNVASSSKNLKYYFRLSPTIRSTSTLAFQLITNNKSPSDSFLMSLSVLDIQNNRTIAAAEAKVPPRGREWIEEVSLNIPQEISLRPYALRTRSFRIFNSSQSPELVRETFHKIHGDLRKSIILILLDKPNEEYVATDTVDFTVLILNRQWKPFNTEKNVSIYIWETHYNKEKLLKRWNSVTIRPEKPFVRGEFIIPLAIQDGVIQTSEFKILVTLDERLDDDPTHLEGLTPIKYISPRIILSKELFYSHAIQSIVTSTKYKHRTMNLATSITPPFVTLKNPEFTVEANATNSFGYPVKSGVCKVQDQISDRCAIAELREVNITGGRISFTVNSTQLINPNCLKEIFQKNSSFCFKLRFKCRDNELQEETPKGTFSQVCLTETDFLISHMFISAPIPTLLFRVTANNWRPLKDKDTAGNYLQVSYVFNNQSKVSVNEPILYGEIAEHSLHSVVDNPEVSHLQVTFKDFTLNVSKCDGCLEKVNTDRHKSWLTSALFESQTDVVAGQPVEIAVPSELPCTHFRIILKNTLGEKEDTLQPLKSSRNTSSKFVTFVTFFIPQDTLSVEFNKNLFLTAFRPLLPPVLLHETSRNELLVSPPNDTGGPQVFGIAFRPLYTTQPVLTYDIWNDCSIENPPYYESCESFYPANTWKPRITKDLNPDQGEQGKESILAELNLNENSKYFNNGWLFNSSLTSSDSLSIRTSIPLGLSRKQKVYGILIDDIHGIRMTQPLTFDPKPPLVLHTLSLSPSYPQMRRYTLINNSNSTITQVNFYQKDLNKLIVFDELPGGEDNFTRNFFIPPHSSAQFERLYKRNTTDVYFWSPCCAIANIIVVASFNGGYAVDQTTFEFPLPSRG